MFLYRFSPTTLTSIYFIWIHKLIQGELLTMLLVVFSDRASCAGSVGPWQAWQLQQWEEEVEEEDLTCSGNVRVTKQEPVCLIHDWMSASSWMTSRTLFGIWLHDVSPQVPFFMHWVKYNLWLNYRKISSLKLNITIKQTGLRSCVGFNPMLRY